MRYLSLVALFLLGTFQFAYSQCTSALYEDFESGGFTGTYTVVGAYTQTFPTTGAAQGTTFLRNTGNGGISSAHIIDSFALAQPDYISFYVRTPTTTDATSYVVIGDNNTLSSLGMIYCYFSGATGNFRLYDGTTHYDVPTVANQWFFVEARNIDWVNYEFEYYVDNNLLGTDVPFRSGPIAGVDRAILFNLNGTHGDYDEINIGGAPLGLSATTGTILCNGGTADIDLTVSGASGSQTYTWSNGAITEDLTGVAAGTYDVTVDDGGCTATGSYTIAPAPSAITVSDLVTDAAACSGTGDIDLTVSGGAGGFTYAWSNGAVTEDLTGVAVGTYDVTVTDANGCTTTGSYTVGVAGNLIFAEDFETGGFTPANGWIDNTGGSYTATFPATGAAQGTYYLNNIGSSGHTEGWEATFTPSQPDEISWWMRTDNLSSANNYFVVGDANTSTNLGVLFCYFTGTGGNSLRFYNGTGYNHPVSANTWYHVEIKDIDWTNEHFDIYVDGTLIQTDFAFRNSATSVDRVILYSLNSSNSNYDDIRIGGGVQLPTLSATTGTILCNGGTADIDLTVTNASGSQTYLWSNGAITEDLTGVAAGTYDVTVDDGGCTVSGSYTIAAGPSAISVTESINNVDCNGNSTGGVDLTVSGGTAGYTYLWSNGAVTEDISGVAAGTYDVTVTDANSCTYTDSYTVTEPTVLSASASVNHATCGTGTGDIDLTASGGTTGYAYAWSNGAASEDLTAVAAGTYSVTVTDGNGCTYTDSYTINASPALGLSANVGTILCNGGTTDIDLTVTGTTGTPTFNWSSGQTTEDITGLTAGTYNVTVVDGSCSATGSYTVAAAPSALTVTPIINNAPCNGGVGDVTLNTSGGTPGYTFNWSNGGNTNSITGVAPGTYDVTVTDGNGCTYTDSYTVTEPTAVSATAVVTDVDCNGNTNGAIDITATGGTPAYTYQWSNGAIVADPSGLAGGIYDVTVTDANGCTFATSFTVAEPQPLVGTPNILNPSCYGGTGNVSVSVTGGTPGYTYNWSNGNNTGSLTAVVAGTYDVTVTDANGCTFADSYTLVEPDSITISETITNPVCFGGTGDIVLAVTGGTPGYTYNWSNGNNTNSLTAVTAGTYDVTVTDANGCFKVATYMVTQPAPINVNPAITTPTCYGGTGDIVLNVVGGTAPFSYNWSNGNNTNSLTGVLAGNYTVTITDDNGCVFVNTYNLQQPAEIQINAAVNDASCNSGRGDILLLVSGGTGTLSINWNTGATSFSLISVPAGSYSVTVTDGNGCTASDSYVINEPTPINVTASVTDALCNGGTGDIVLTTTGGQGTYTYNWSNGNNTNSLTAVAAGGYGVTVTDTSGCSFNGYYEILNPDTISLSADITDAACNGGTGDVVLTASGGTPGYTYDWSNGNNTNSLTAVLPGTYDVTVTDANGCSNTGSYTLTEPATPVTVVVDTTTPDLGADEGTVLITAAGGTSPYAYSWSNGATTRNLNGVATGMYYVTVTDDAGCSATDSAFVDFFVGVATEPVVENIPADMDVWPNPFENAFTIALRDWNAGEVVITLFDASGRVVYSRNVEVMGIEEEITVSEYLSSGIYFLNVHNNKNSMTRKLIRE